MFVVFTICVLVSQAAETEPLTENDHQPTTEWWGRLPAPASWSEKAPTEWFTVFTRDDFEFAPCVEAYAVFQANRDEVAKLAGILPKQKTDAWEYRFQCPDNRHLIQHIGIASWWQRNWMGDQFILVTFNDGATVRYTQPRYGKLVRDRTDVWVRCGVMATLSQDLWGNGNDLKSEPLTSYPEQLHLIRPRVDGDPEFDRSYAGQARVLKRAAVGGGVIGGVLVGAVATCAAVFAAPTAVTVAIGYQACQAILVAGTVAGGVAGGKIAHHEVGDISDTK